MGRYQHRFKFDKGLLPSEREKTLTYTSAALKSIKSRGTLWRKVAGGFRCFVCRHFVSEFEAYSPDIPWWQLHRPCVHTLESPMVSKECERCHGEGLADAVQADYVETAIVADEVTADLVAKRKLSTLVMSYFDDHWICSRCEAAEKAHPLYEEAGDE